MAKVIKAFNDAKDNNKLYSPKGLNEYTGSRVNELIKKGYLEGEIIEEKEEKELTIAEIKALLDEKGIEYDSKMKKAELLAKLG